MASGKLSGKSLRENVLNLLERRREEVLVGANLGGDCASLRFDGDFVVHTDPITGATKEIGSLAVKVVLNDISAGFGEPVAILLTLLLPEKMDESDVKAIMLDAEAEAKKWDAEIVGGHTEFTDAVTRPVVNAVGIGKRRPTYEPHQVKVGDSIIITKQVALEGSMILADAYADKLCLSQAEKEEIETYSALTSVCAEAKCVRASGISAAMHDVTEGGIFGALAEMSDILGIGIEVDTSVIPVSELSLKICDFLGINPYKLISSGSMIIVTSNAQNLKKQIESIGIKATIIGRVTEDKGAYAVIDGEKKKIMAEPDELFRKYGE